MNRRLLPIVSAVAVATALPLFALAQWTGAPGTPPNSNARGPVWLQTGAPTAQTGKISVTEGRINSATHTQDLYISTGKAIRSFGANNGVINFGNYETGASGFTLGVYGNLTVPGFGGSNTGQICLNGSCISSWPGAPADVWVNTTGDTMTGSLTISGGNSLCLGGVCNSSWPSSGGTIGGSGNAGYVPRFTPNGTTLGNSAIQSDGTRVGIGASPIAGNFVNINAGSDSTALRAVTAGDTGVYGQGGNYGLNGSGGTYGVYGGGGTYGVYGYGGYGVYGNGNPTGVYGTGNTYGVYGTGNSYGIYGTSPTYGVYGTGPQAGLYGQGTAYGAMAYGSSFGVYGRGESNFGVVGSSGSYYGVQAIGGAGGFYTDNQTNYFGSNFSVSAGLVYVGASPTELRIVNPAGYNMTHFNYANSAANYIRGTTYIDNYAGASDERLKDVHGSFDRGLDALATLNPISYTYKKGTGQMIPEDGKERIGVTAQEVKKVIPEAVFENKDGYLMLNNDPIIWTMVNSIKELKAQNEELKARIEKLEAK